MIGPPPPPGGATPGTGGLPGAAPTPPPGVGMTEEELMAAWAAAATGDPGMTTADAIVLWRERERRQRTVRVLMMFLLMLLLMDGDNNNNNPNTPYNNNNPNLHPNQKRLRHKNGGSAAGHLLGIPRPLEAHVYHSRQRQDQLLKQLFTATTTESANNPSVITTTKTYVTQPHPRYQYLLQKNGNQDIPQTVMRWATNMAEQEKDEFAPPQLLQHAVSSSTLQKRKTETTVVGASGGGGAVNNNNKAQQRLQQQNYNENEEDDDQKVVFHYPWNSTGFYRGEWTRIQPTMSKTVAPSKSLDNNNTTTTKTIQQGSSSRNSKQQLPLLLSALDLEPSMLKVLQQHDHDNHLPTATAAAAAAVQSSVSLAGVYLLPPNTELLLRNDNNLTSMGWERITVDAAGRHYYNNNNLQQQQQSTTTLAAAEQQQQESSSTTTLGTPPPVVPPRITLTHDSGRAAFQLFSRSIPSMTELSLVDGFVKLYDSNSPGYSTRKDILLRVRGVLLHSIGRLSLVANADVNRSALVIQQQQREQSSSSAAAQQQQQQRSASASTASNPESLHDFAVQQQQNYHHHHDRERTLSSSSSTSTTTSATSSSTQSSVYSSSTFPGRSSRSSTTLIHAAVNTNNNDDDNAAQQQQLPHLQGPAVEEQQQDTATMKTTMRNSGTATTENTNDKNDIDDDGYDAEETHNDSSQAAAVRQQQQQQQQQKLQRDVVPLSNQERHRRLTENLKSAAAAAASTSAAGDTTSASGNGERVSTTPIINMEEIREDALALYEQQIKHHPPQFSISSFERKEEENMGNVNDSHNDNNNNNNKFQQNSNNDNDEDRRRQERAADRDTGDDQGADGDGDLRDHEPNQAMLFSKERILLGTSDSRSITDSNNNNNIKADHYNHDEKQQQQKLDGYLPENQQKKASPAATTTSTKKPTKSLSFWLGSSGFTFFTGSTIPDEAVSAGRRSPGESQQERILGDKNKNTDSSSSSNPNTVTTASSTNQQRQPTSLLLPWSDIVLPYPFVRDDKDETIRKTRTPAARRMPPREQLLEANAGSCEFEINMDVQEVEWTVGAWRTLLTRRVKEQNKLNPTTQTAAANGDGGEEKDDGSGGSRQRSRSALSRSIMRRIKPPQDEALVMTMVGKIVSFNCNFEAILNATAQRTDWDATTSKAINYSFYMMLVCLTQILVLLRQLLHSQSQAAATRVSLLCIGWQTIIDALVCFAHIYLSLALQPLFTAFASVAFFKLLIFCVIEMKYMAMIIQARNSSNGGQTAEVLRRQVAMLHLRFYIALFATFLLTFYVGDKYRLWYMLGLYSFWWPQIVMNIITEAKTPLHKNYIYGMAASRLVAPIYTFGLSNNFLKEVYPDSPTDTFTCQMLILWVGLQTAILIAQGKYGARFMIPARFLPPKFDYSRPLPPSMIPPGMNETSSSSSYTQSHQLNGNGHTQFPRNGSAPDRVDSVEATSTAPDRHTTSVTTRHRNRGNRAKQRADRNAAVVAMTTTATAHSYRPSASLSSTAAAAAAAAEQQNHTLDCSICYDAIDVRNRRGYMLAPCDHIFHRDCLVQWMDVKMECPICRTELPAI